MKKNTNLLSNNKKVVISASIAIAIMLVVLIGVVLIKSKGKNENVKTEKSYTVTGDEPINFSGISVISDEQKIMIDKLSGEVRDVNVEDGQAVKSGDLLFNYYNTDIEKQINEYDKKIQENDNKINEISKQESDHKNNVNQLEEELKKVSSRLLTIQSSLTSNEKSQQEVNKLVTEKNTYEKNVTEISSKKQLLDSEINALNAQVDSYKNENQKLISEKDELKQKLVKNVYAEIDGIAEVNKEALKDNALSFIRIISEKSLVKAQVSEFDVDSLNVDDEVLLKVLSTDEYVNGRIVKIDKLPVENLANTVANSTATATTTTYNFYVEPEKNIRIGFNVEIKYNYKNIVIPRECLYEKNSHKYVLKKNKGGNEEVEVKVIEYGDNIYLINGFIISGDVLIRNPSNLIDGDEMND